MTYPFDPVNLADFKSFVSVQMGVPDASMPSDTDLAIAFQLAKDTVNLRIWQASRHYYNLAVYNWAGDYLINWATDPMCSTFWEKLRESWGMTNFVAGVVASTSDESTSTSLQVSKSLDNLSISDLQMMKTPYGRAYLAIAQKWGDSWGLS